MVALGSDSLIDVGDVQVHTHFYLNCFFGAYMFVISTDNNVSCSVPTVAEVPKFLHPINTLPPELLFGA